MAIICTGAVLFLCGIDAASAEEPSPAISKSRLSDMGLGGMQSMSDVAGQRVRGNRAIFGGTGAVGIPLDSVSRARLVALFNWSYHPGILDIPTVIWRHLPDSREDRELLPPPRREF